MIKDLHRQKCGIPYSEVQEYEYIVQTDTVKVSTLYKKTSIYPSFKHVSP